jgi:hypothetical protein
MVTSVTYLEPKVLAQAFEEAAIRMEQNPVINGGHLWAANRLREWAEKELNKQLAQDTGVNL